jgi:uncharacterized protein YsxB (DUF464 family)
MIDITFNAETLELKIEGHAEHGDKGEDIVCSAISALFYTLAESVNQSATMLKEKPIFKDKDGNGYLRCKPKEEYAGNIARSFWTILIGFEMVAAQYPENVKFKVEG